MGSAEGDSQSVEAGGVIIAGAGDFVDEKAALPETWNFSVKFGDSILYREVSGVCSWSRKSRLNPNQL
jgi:hypothetical protein